MTSRRNLGGVVGATVVVLVSLSSLKPAEAALCGQRENDVHAPYRQVTWKDFKGKLPKSLGPKAAHIASAILLKNFDIDSRQDGEDWVARPTKICLYASMNKLESARRVGHEKPALLAHEQAHFDITEVFTRTLYGKVKAMVVRDSDPGQAAAQLRSQVAVLYQETVAEWKAMQSRYDSESLHGTHKRKQKRWLAQVKKLLADTPPVGS
ncbi:MAG: DUF922 domain-containing protein [Deltaproteobacteria bacterium]|nr:DUF922 domain-containing protein [Deltaproteobacteria bacterium]